MVFQCWSNVFDAGPTLKQHWVMNIAMSDIGVVQATPTHRRLNGDVSNAG